VAAALPNPKVQACNNSGNFKEAEKRPLPTFRIVTGREFTEGLGHEHCR
jgi:hypothetical protein